MNKKYVTEIYIPGKKMNIVGNYMTLGLLNLDTPKNTENGLTIESC